MHVLLIHSGFFSSLENSMHGLFQRQQANLLYKNSHTVGVLSAGFLPFLPSKNLKHELFSDNTLPYPVLRKYRISLLLGRWMQKLFKKIIISDCMHLFEKYVSKYGRPDIIHAHNCFYAGIVSSYIKSTYFIPFVLTENSSAFQRNLLSRLEIQNAKSIFIDADQLCFVSEYQAQKILSILSKKNIPYKVVYNMVDEKLNPPFPINTQINKSRFVFLSIGTLDANKNHALLIESFAKSFSDTDGVTLRIIGGGVLFKRLNDRIDKLKVSNKVKLLGEYGRSQIADEIAESDCIVSSSNVETFGVALIEGLLFGKPIISTASGGPNEIVNESNGLLVQTEDIDALSDAMSRVYTTVSSYIPTKIQEECIRRFGEKSYLDRIESIYASVLKA